MEWKRERNREGGVEKRERERGNEREKCVREREREREREELYMSVDWANSKIERYR
jgi:hypothetical protein